MPPEKNLVLFLDGTWARLDKGEESNVARLFRKTSWLNQQRYYDSGLGTGWTKVLGGFAGLGFRRNVRQAYHAVVEHYRPGVRIFIVGWSRGATEARTLCEWLHYSGVVHSESLIDDAWRAFRLHTRPPPADWVTVQGCLCFDTVGALGIPLHWWHKITILNRGFRNLRASSSLRNGLHLVAIDERRKSFAVTPWKGRQITTIYLPGDHADVGGGRAGGLADISLQTAGIWLQARGVRMCPD